MPNEWLALCDHFLMILSHSCGPVNAIRSKMLHESKYKERKCIKIQDAINRFCYLHDYEGNLTKSKETAQTQHSFWHLGKVRIEPYDHEILVAHVQLPKPLRLRDKPTSLANSVLK